MTSMSSLARCLTLLLLSGISLAASAHSGADAGGHHGISFLDGMLHPLTGPDHLAAMLAVGCWSALTARRAWLAPLAFASMLLIGAIAGLRGLSLPAGEPAIVTSLLVLGLLFATRRALPVAAATILVAAFAVFHGMAHGLELAAAPQAWSPLVGLMLSTLVLHLGGMGLGRWLKQFGPGPSRVAGGAVVLLGLTLMLRMVHA